MSYLKTVFCNGGPIMAPQQVLFEMGLTEGQEISEEQMWDLISKTATNVINDESMRTANKSGCPADTTELEGVLKSYLRQQ